MATISGAAGRKLQKRAPRKDGWSKAVRARFLDAFAATCNAKWAAASVSRTPSSLYALKRRDPEFALLCHEALRDGYERLEAELLARALGQTGDEENPGDDDRGEPPALPPFDPMLALKILQMRQAEATRGNDRRSRTFRRVTQEETDAELMRKLAAAERRLKLVTVAKPDA